MTREAREKWPSRSWRCASLRNCWLFASCAFPCVVSTLTELSSALQARLTKGMGPAAGGFGGGFLLGLRYG